MLEKTIALPETNVAPENQWLEDSFPFGMTYFQVGSVSFWEVLGGDGSSQEQITAPAPDGNPESLPVEVFTMLELGMWDCS